MRSSRSKMVAQNMNMALSDLHLWIHISGDSGGPWTQCIWPLCIFISWIIQSGYSCWGYCYVHCKFEFLGTRNPEKVLLLVILSLFVGEICQNVHFDGSRLETSNRTTPCQCYCHSHIRIGFLGAKNPRKVVLFVILWLFVRQKCTNVFSDGGHFESSNMATPSKIGFGSRQIWVQQVKMYLCTKFDAFVRIWTFIPLTALTSTVLFVSISQGCEDRLRNNLYCVGWGVELYSNQTKVAYVDVESLKKRYYYKTRLQAVVDRY